jgi:hypothetical protein
MTNKNNNKSVSDIILERAQSIDWDNMDSWTSFDSSMTEDEIVQKFMKMVNTAKQSKGK